MRNLVKYKLLSYPLSAKTKGYGAKKVVSICWHRQLTRGDTCNASSVQISSHAGTHVDFPRHFLKRGKALTDYSVRNFVFTRPFFIDCPKASNQMIVPQDIAKFHAELKKSDILLLKTHFCKLRNKNIYYKHNPGVSPDLARLIRKKYSNIKCVGIDSISVSAYQKREIGRDTHRIFLQGKSPVLLIEDMDLSAHISVLRRIEKIIVSPLYIKNLEASSCTVIGCM